MSQLPRAASARPCSRSPARSPLQSPHRGRLRRVDPSLHHLPWQAASGGDERGGGDPVPEFARGRRQGGRLGAERRSASRSLDRNVASTDFMESASRPQPRLCTGVRTCMVRTSFQHMLESREANAATQSTIPYGCHGVTVFITLLEQDTCDLTSGSTRRPRLAFARLGCPRSLRSLGAREPRR